MELGDLLLGWHLVVLGALCLIGMIVTLNLSVFRRPAGREWEAGEAPLVSVLVPARNEEANIADCLGSLVAQDFPNLEIILLDDHSGDRTAGIAQALGFGPSGGRRIIAGEDLPDGWTGKGWACWQLSRAAQGEYLFFTDADTRHAPDSVSALLGHAAGTKADLLSAWPEQETGTFAERLVIPLVYLLILGFLPQALLVFLQRFPSIGRRIPGGRSRALGAANGQVMLFRRAAYEAIGGHMAVRDHLVEDLALGREVAKRLGQGMRLVNCDGRGRVRCRMYRSAREVWEGFSKNLRPAFEDSTGAFVVSLAVQFLILILPFLLLPFAGSYFLLVFLQVAMIYLIRGALTLRFQTSWLGAVLHPVAHGFALLIALNSWRCWGRDSLVWKGRSYGRHGRTPEAPP